MSMLIWFDWSFWVNISLVITLCCQTLDCHIGRIIYHKLQTVSKLLVSSDSKCFLNWSSLPNVTLRSFEFMYTSRFFLTGYAGLIHREIMPLGIAMPCATWCHSGICQSGERRMSRHLYTVAVGYQIKA